MKLIDQLKGRALELGGKAMGKLLEDPKRAERVGQVFGAVQKGKRRVEDAQGQVLNAMGFASARDYKELKRQVSHLKRQAQQMLEKLEKLG